MENIEYKNPNDIYRKIVQDIYKNSKKEALLNDKDPVVVFNEALKKMLEENPKLYSSLLQVMFVEYSISEIIKEKFSDEDEILELEEYEDEYDYEEDEEEDISSIESLDDLINFSLKNPITTYDMAQSIDVREIDLSSIYSSLYALSDEQLKLICSIFPAVIFDFLEFRYPFVIGKLEKNLKTNPFSKDTTTKNITIIDLLEEIKEYVYEDYIKLLTYYLEIYYKNKKYMIEMFDSVLSKKEKELIKKLDNKDLSGAIEMIDSDVDLLEVVLDSYSSVFFENDKLKRTVDRFYKGEEKEEELRLIFGREEN